MIQEFSGNLSDLARRRVGAFLLVICLNLAIIPCAMALEAVEQGHDCCPTEVQLKASECCELDAASVDSRGATLKVDNPPDQDALPVAAPFRTSGQVPDYFARCVDPPDPPGDSSSLHKLYCVYLR